MVTDIFLSKWDTAGNLIWGTYFGGEGMDRVINLGLDAEGNILLLGWAQSDTNITTNGAFQEYTMSVPNVTTNPNIF